MKQEEVVGIVQTTTGGRFPERFTLVFTPDKLIIVPVAKAGREFREFLFAVSMVIAVFGVPFLLILLLSWVFNLNFEDIGWMILPLAFFILVLFFIMIRNPRRREKLQKAFVKDLSGLSLPDILREKGSLVIPYEEITQIEVKRGKLGFLPLFLPSITISTLRGKHSYYLYYLAKPQQCIKHCAELVRQILPQKIVSL